MKLSEKIVQMRKGMGLSQEQLAELCGVSRQAVSKWENGQAQPELDKVLVLAKVFSISTDELLGLTSKASEGSEGEKEDEPDSASVLNAYLQANRQKRCFTLGWVTALVSAVLLLIELMLCPVMQYIERVTFNQFCTDSMEYLNHFPLNIMFPLTALTLFLGLALVYYGIVGKNQKLIRW